MKKPRSSHCTVTLMPRRAMSSVKEVRRDRVWFTFAGVEATKDPDPCRCTIRPSSTSDWIALRTVTRLNSVIVAISRSGGSGLPGARSPPSTPSDRRLRSCR